MPVTFYIDPDLAKDRNLADVTDIALSYTFFRASKLAENRDPGGRGGNARRRQRNRTTP